MDSGLKGKTALVTGGGTGIGRALALALAQEGVDVAIASRNPPLETQEEIEACGVRGVSIRADVSQEEQVVDMVTQAIDTFGHLDLYVNNAAWAWHQPFSKITTESWMKTINTNLSACIWATREVGKHMIARRQGCILIVGSTAQFNRSFTETSYHISKTGIRVLMESLATELAPFGVRVNLLVPGHYPTRLTAGITETQEQILKGEIPLRRFGKPEELGPAAVLLLSDKLSAYTTGSQLVVDGGLHLRPLRFNSDEELRELNEP